MVIKPRTNFLLTDLLRKQLKKVRTIRWDEESGVPDVYQHLQGITHEIDDAEVLFASNPEWTVIDVTGK